VIDTSRQAAKSIAADATARVLVHLRGAVADRAAGVSCAGGLKSLQSMLSRPVLRHVFAVLLLASFVACSTREVAVTPEPDAFIILSAGQDQYPVARLSGYFYCPQPGLISLGTFSPIYIS